MSTPCLVLEMRFSHISITTATRELSKKHDYLPSAQAQERETLNNSNCSYLLNPGTEIDDHSLHAIAKSKGLKIASLNVNSLLKHIDESGYFLRSIPLIFWQSMNQK